MASAVAASEAPVQVRVGGQTDIGGGRENQDMWFCWKDKNNTDTTVFGVLDGHGREVGRLAAVTGRDALMDWLERPTAMEQLRRDPVKTFGRMFAHAHLKIKESFRRCLEESGWLVNEAPEGFLMRRRHESQSWSCLHGGASCSVIALVDGRLFSANVGDSSSLLSVSEVEGPETGGAVASSSTMVPPHCAVRLCDLASAHLQDETCGFKMEKAFLADAQASILLHSSASPSHTEQAQVAEAQLDQLLAQCADLNNGDRLTLRGQTLPLEPTKSFVVSADHSPEAHTEFERLRRTRPKPSDSRCPDLMMVYDSPTNSGSKASCPQVFEVDRSPEAPSDALPRITNKGKYYKNVRSEWASLVTTPASARFQDALAFTRSLGDFHLQSFGVCFLPEVFEIDLTAILPTGQSGHKLVTLFVCSDGIWDNWKFEDVTQFMLAKENMMASLGEPPIAPGTRMVEPVTDGQIPAAQMAANKLIDKNAKLAHANFGNSADNATAVVAFLWR